MDWIGFDWTRFGQDFQETLCVGLDLVTVKKSSDFSLYHFYINILLLTNVNVFILLLNVQYESLQHS